MEFKIHKRTLLTALLAVMAVVCAVLAISFLIPSSQTLTASADDSSHTSHDSGWQTFSSSSSKTLTSGKYYLGSDVSGKIIISSSANVTLCLNGHTLTGSGSNYVVSVGYKATLILCDCGSSGKITGGSSTTYGGGVYVGNGSGTFIMYGGTISGNAAKVGGGVYVNGGTFNMYGGTISGNTASSDGGGVYVGSSGAFNMYGGTISGNTASSNGGGVYVNGSNGNATITGGTISGNTATSGSGGGVYVNSGTFTMSNGTISTNTASSNGGGVYSSGAFTMSDGTISGNTATSGSGGGVYSSGAFTMSDGTISSNTATSGSGGGVYVNGGTFTMSGGSITSSNKATSYGGGVYVNSGTFKMSKGTISQNSAKNGGGVYVSSGTFTMSDGTISGNTASSEGGGVYVSETGEFNMSGGTIASNTATSYGGGVVVYCTFEMTGGTISSNKAGSGGGVYVSWLLVASGCGVYMSGTFTMSDSTISGNTASSGNGGGVYVIGGEFTMNGGSAISNNTASGNGGGVYLSNSGYSSVFNMSGATITGNTASSGNGGGVYVNSGTFTMSGSSAISSNSANSGGGVFVANGGGFTMNNGKISGNKASGSGGNGGGVNVSGSFTMKDGTISSNTSTSSNSGEGGGGGVRVNSTGVVTMSGGTISDNNAIYGGGVYVGGKFTMSGGTISGNTATKGNGVYVNSKGTFTVEGGDIEDEVYKVSGGTISVTGGYYSAEAYEDISDYIDSSCAGVNLTEFTTAYSTAYSSGRSKRSVEDYYAVYSKGDYSISDIEETYDGNECGAPTVSGTYCGGNYTVYVLYSWCSDYGNCLTLPTNAGSYTVTAIIISVSSDKSNIYTGTTTFNITINPKSIESGAFCLESGDYTYDGTAHKADINCTSGLSEDSDYTVTYSDAVSAGTVTVTVSGINNYTGTVQFSYTIKQKELTSDMFCVTGDYTYDGTKQEAEISCIITGLSKDKDYTVSYSSDTVNAGWVTVTITGIGNCTGTVYVTYEIAKATVQVTLCGETVTYNGSAQSLTVSGLPTDGNVTVTYYYVSEDGTTTTEAPINVGTYTVKAVFTSDNYDISEVSATLTIKKASRTLDGVTLSGSTVTYDGSAHSLAISGKLSDGITVAYYYISEDGTTTTEAPVNAGTYTVKAVFTSDNYDISDLTATLTIKKATLSVEAVTGITAKVGDSLDDIELPEGWSWSDSATLDKVGEFGFEATYSAGDNYETITATITVSVIGSGLSGGEIAGIVIASVAFVILVAVIVVFIRKRKKGVE